MPTYSKKIEIQVLETETDRVGNSLRRWATLVTAWAEVNCIGGNEYYKAAQINAEKDMIFKLRYSRQLAGYLPSQIRLIYDGAAYDVKHIDDYMEQHRTLVMRAQRLNSGGVT